MVRVSFELPSDLVATLLDFAKREQKRIDDIVDLALRKYWEDIPSGEDIAKPHHLALPPELAHKANTRAPKAHGKDEAFADVAHQPRPGLQRRRFERVQVDLPIAYSIVGDDAWHNGRIMDLSGGGARISATADIMQGSQLILRFTLPQAQHGILTYGRVVTSVFDDLAKQYSHGVAFIRIGHAD